jgi:hypothetical protein
MAKTRFGDILRIKSNGFIDYNDLATQSVPIAYTSGTIKITNDGLGAYTQDTYKPKGSSPLWKTDVNQFDFSSLDIGNEAMVRIDVEVETTVSNQEVCFDMVFGIGESEYSLNVETVSYKTAGWHKIVRACHFYIGNTITKNNPAELRFHSDGDDNANIKVNGFYISVLRRL